MTDSVFVTIDSVTYGAPLDSIVSLPDQRAYIGCINADCLQDTVISSYHSTTGTYRPSRIMWGVSTSSTCTDSIPAVLKVSSTAIVYPPWPDLRVGLSIDQINPDDTLQDLVLHLLWSTEAGQHVVDTSRSIVVFGQKNLVTIATIDIASIGITQVRPYYARELQAYDELIEPEMRDLSDSYSYFYRPIINLPVEITLDATVLLEGPFNGSSTMNYLLEQQSFLPTQHPFNVTPFNYAGSETMSTTASIVSNLVDWVLIEIRKEATSATLGRRAVLLREDGKIVDIDGVSNPVLPMLESVADSCYLIIRHRNHLAIMSAVKVVVNSNKILPYNFTGSASTAFATTGIGIKQLGSSGLYGMISGDVNDDNKIDATDRAKIINDTALYGYYKSDCSLDGIVNAIDRVTANNNVFKTSQVP